MCIRDSNVPQPRTIIGSTCSVNEPSTVAIKERSGEHVATLTVVFGRPVARSGYGVCGHCCCEAYAAQHRARSASDHRCSRRQDPRPAADTKRESWIFVLYPVLASRTLRMVATDLDGTIIPYGQGVSARTRAALQAVSYTHLRAHETDSYLVCRLLLEKKKND